MADRQKPAVVKESVDGAESDVVEGAVGGSDLMSASGQSNSSVSEGQGRADIAVVSIAAWPTNEVLELPITHTSLPSSCAGIDPAVQARSITPVGICHVMPVLSTLPATRTARPASTENPVASQPVKKRSNFWSFLKRSKRAAPLQNNESGEDHESIASAEASGCFSRGGICTRNDSHQSVAKSAGPHRSQRQRQTPDSLSSNFRLLSLGASSRPLKLLPDSQLMTVVVPAPCFRTLNDISARTRGVDSTLVRDVDGESLSNAVGYPHLQISHSSSSSSSSSSGISVPAPAPPTPDYPPFCSSMPTVHTQVDYMHCLVPDLLQLTNRMFYWGVMDRYEAEKLLDGRPEGTFLVRDSAQEEFLFSVSFRRYGRSLHARIEQWNHQFSFDSHDLGVFAAPSVCALVEHYKDPAACLFFEPMLTLPLARTYPFSLQHLCRAVICSGIRYDDISSLRLPARIQDYLKYYHYKQRICVRRFESHRVVSE